MKFNGKIVLPAKKSHNNGQWSFPEQMGNHVGFIYVIRDHYMKKLYLGKKLFVGTGKLNKGVESNWKKYTSSSKILNEMLSNRPRDEFEFLCIEQYKTKGTLSYSETWSLCLVEAPTSKEWYNTLIDKVSWPVKEAITDRHKERLQRVIAWEKFND